MVVSGFLVNCKFAEFTVAHFRFVYRCSYQRQCVVRKEFGHIKRIVDRDLVLVTVCADCIELYGCCTERKALDFK